MQATEDLFNLIKSLSKSEKRAFKLSAGRSTAGVSNNYLKLFDAIDEQTAYDEAQVKAYFTGEALVNNFSVAKAYLYEAILGSLRNARLVMSKDMEVRRLLDHIELLHKRGLYDQASKVLRKGLRLSRCQGLLPYETELLRWQRRLVNLQSGKDRYTRLAQVEFEEQSALSKLQQEAQLRSIRAQVQSIFLNQIDLRKPAISQLLATLMAHPVLARPPEPEAFFARLAFHHIHAIHARLKADPLGAVEHYLAALTTWEEHPKLITSLPDQYIVALTSYLDSCMRAHAYDTFVATISKLHELPLKDPRLKARAFYFGNHLELRFAISTGQLSLGIDRRPEIEAGLKKHIQYLSTNIELTILYNLAVVYFLAGDFHGAVGLSNRILNRPSTAVRVDLIDGTRLFELVAHFELGNYDLVDSLLRSMQRRLRTHPREHAFEQVLVKGLRKLMAVQPSERRSAYEELQLQFSKVEGAAYLVAREELVFWIRSKLEGKPVSTLLAEQVVQP